MIKVITSHNHIWEPQDVALDIVQSFQTLGYAVIEMNGEGPCADSVGLYKILNSLCAKFGFDKKNITIVTGNREETHSEYNIIKKPNSWLKQTYKTSINNKFLPEHFDSKKQIGKNLFGCLYNIPSWNRLCLASYIKYHTSRPSLLACNGTWQPHEHNSIYLNPVTDFCAQEFANIARLLNDGIDPLPEHPGHKPNENENTLILKWYNDFFIDMVAETYSNGLTFFPTEKTFRPMFAHTPFLIFGPQGFLSTLKSDFGFKTFDKWWDESYDQYQNYERIRQIYKVIDFVDQCSDSDLVTMYQQMQPVLQHNFRQLKILSAYEQR